MRFGTGSAWVRRRIAKPLDTGSIPARASMTRDRVAILHKSLGPAPHFSGFWPRQWKYWLGQRLAWWALENDNGGCRSFASGLVYPIAAVGGSEVYQSASIKAALGSLRRLQEVEQERDRYRRQAIEARQELSRLKRGAA